MFIKKYIILIILALTVSLSFAQSSTYIGVKGGYNIGSTFIKHTINRINIRQTYKSGYHFGLMAINYIQKNVGLQAELNYTQKGWIQKFSPTKEFVQNMDYLELPILMNIYIGNKKTRLFFNLGMFLEFLATTSHNGIPNDTLGFDFFYYQSERDKKFGYGLTGGGGFYFDFSFGTLLIESRFSFSQSNVINSGTLDSGIPNISNHFVTTISVGYLFRFGKGV